MCLWREAEVAAERRLKTKHFSSSQAPFSFPFWWDNNIMEVKIFVFLYFAMYRIVFLN